MKAWPDLYVLSVGRTVDPYSTRTLTSEENREGLHSLLCLLRGARDVRVLASMTVEHGGSPNGKLAATQSGFEMPRPKQERPRGVTLAAWDVREERRTTTANVAEMAVRLATADLMLFLPAHRPVVQWDLQSGVPVDLGAEHPEPHALLQPSYSQGQARLRQAGLFRLAPVAGVVASASRWDFERLLALEAFRTACGIGAPLLIVVHPNEMAQRNGMCTSPSAARTPYPLLLARARLAGADPPPLPPIWWIEGSSAVPPEPTDLIAQSKALTAWRTAAMPSKHSRNNGSAVAGASAAAQIVPQGQQRARTPSLKKRESDRGAWRIVRRRSD